MTENGIILSICMSGRNDDYGKDFKRRFEQSMNFLAYSARKAGVLDNIEVLFTDWNSDISLAEVIGFSNEASRIVKFIIVPPDIAREYNYNNTPFHTTVSINTAIRRANGRFIAFMPGDVLVPEFTLDRLFRIIREETATFFDLHKSLLCIPRKLIPENFNDDFSWSGKDMNQISRSLVNMDFCLQSSYICPGDIGGSGMFVFDIAVVEELCGFDENFGGWGNSDHYFALEAGRKYPIVNLFGYGLFVYDFQPDNKFMTTKHERTNPIVPLGFRLKNESWGLYQHSFDVIAGKVRQDASPISNRKKIFNSFDEIFNRITDSKYKDELILKISFPAYFNLEYSSDFTPLVQLFPRDKTVNYLDICSPGVMLKFLSILNPFSNLYFIPPLNPEGQMNPEFINKLILSNYEYENPHFGAIRFIPDFPRQAVDDLKNSSGEDNLKFDFIRFNCGSLKDDSIVFFKTDIYDILADDGIMVFYGEREYFKNFCSKIKDECDGCTLVICNRLDVGLLIKSPGTKKVVDDDKTQKLLFNAWLSPFKRNVLYPVLHKAAAFAARAFRSLRFRIRAYLKRKGFYRYL
ncbi:MAG: glycosyltransferase family A protein [Vulcanimicrobiota bacterium]